MEPSHPLIVAFYTIAVVSFICSLGVIYHLVFKIERKELRHLFFLLLHISLILEDIASLPVIYVHNFYLCQFMGWLRFYSGLSNVLVLFFYTYHYLSYLTYETYADQINDFIWKYSLYIVVLFPLITLLPFSTNSFDDSQGFICTLPLTRSGNAWALGIFYFIIVILLKIILLEMIRASYQFYKLKLSIYNRFFYSCSVYIYISILCWLPRAYPRLVRAFISYDVSNTFVASITLPLYVSGILYTIVYAIDLTYFASDRITSEDTREARHISLENFAKIFSSNLSPSGSFSSNSANGSQQIENPIRISERSDT